MSATCSPQRHRLLLALALIVVATGIANAHDDPQHLELIARMREAALTYTDRLQDFVCTQLAIRSADKSGSGRHWKRLDVQEFELAYVAHKLHYKLLKVDGRAEDVDTRVRRGYGTSRGEFDGYSRVFSPTAKAEFKWDHDTLENGKRLCVFRYEILRANSTLTIETDAGSQTLGYHGFVHADCESGAVMRIQLESEPGSGSGNGHGGAPSVQADVRYRPTPIGTREFLLPESAITIMRAGNTLTKSEIQFQNYHKFQADSNLVFDAETEVPAPGSNSRAQ